MIMLMYVGHAVSLILYVAVLVTCVTTAFKIRPAKLYGPVKYIVPSFVLALSLQSASFIVLQIDWIYEDFNTLVGDLTAYGWLAYDYFNGFAMLTFITALRIWLSWRLIDRAKDYFGQHGGHNARGDVHVEFTSKRI